MILIQEDQKTSKGESFLGKDHNLSVPGDLFPWSY